MINYENLLDAARFMPTSLRPPSAWCGHMPFASWLVREIRPGCIVELGTHSGNSYFSFCQTVKEAGLPARCFAVDTWRGDEHSGSYDDSVFEYVSNHNKAHYADISTLLRMTFDEASDRFESGSVNLLHIDGLHTIEAVQHDFERWLPKLAPGAFILLHDTHVMENGFGVWKLWEELCLRYPLHLSFHHSFGLGVVQLHDDPGGPCGSWMHAGSVEQEMLISYFAALGDAVQERYNNIDLKERIAHLEKSVASRDDIISLQAKDIQAIRESTSWRLTRPLRWFRTMLSGHSEEEKL